MTGMILRNLSSALLVFPMTLSMAAPAGSPSSVIGREVGLARHLSDGEEYVVGLSALLQHGQRLFTAVWTPQEGGGRPLSKGTGGPLSDPADPLLFPRNFNRISAPDANSCAGCHNQPFGTPGGGGDIVANVFVLGQRFDFATFDPVETTPTKAAMDEWSRAVTLQEMANSRATLGMFGSGYIELLAREMTQDLQAIRDRLAPGQSAGLVSKGVAFGTLSRDASGRWDVSGVEGLPGSSLNTRGPEDPPNLIIRPFHQAGAVVSLREFSNNGFNHHHGMQSAERFGDGQDPDGDGHVNELTRADLTAVALYQAALPVPGRVIPDDPEVARAIWRGEQRFVQIGCAECHRPSLPLRPGPALFAEPNPFNPPGNLQAGQVDPVVVDLADRRLPGPRLTAGHDGIIHVPAYTDLKLHDITSGRDDPNREKLNMLHAPGTPGFLAGNGQFLTRKLWGCANEPPYYHHGLYTTLRQATLAHDGEARTSRLAYEQMSEADQNALIEFLKSLQVLPPGTRHAVVNELGQPRLWPPADAR